ncbi:MAG: hypothetical protein KKE39_08840 [Bacteroidetes bacterium]|nr:hypothetical protein [Bacteroidota bacterium]MBU1373025.1 hypothetical protein [Bacteroidota bacterium]MBU1485468.1 hypothetical protein [Bacteroidota bacterium]MBU1759830.1 hypothetical protein [Bacteroidota bacterium]MBU2047113.1 hypothetical protein [Bacteroidota bacterium]
MKKLILSVLIAFLGYQNLIAQTHCEVSLKEISGSYEGECDGGKANGNGKAKGNDEYVGLFKNGYPDGFGVYTFANGDVYKGEFNKGKFDGEGVLIYAGTKNKLQKGFWKKGKYVGEYQNPYKVYYRTSHIASVNASMNPNNPDKDILLTVSSTTGSGAAINGNPSSELSEIIPVNGSFSRYVKFNETTKKITYKVQQVTYPLRVRLRIGDQEVEIELFENTGWNVDINLNE